MRLLKADYRQLVARGIVSSILFIALYLITAVLLGAILYGIYSAGIISLNSFNFMLEAEILLSLSVAVFLHGRFYKGNHLVDTLRSLGLTADRLSANAIWIGTLLFIIILLFEMAISAFGSFSNTVINTNTSILFTGAPVWFYIFVAVIEPINEEIFFRGFLVNRIGIIPSALIFGLLHASYNSTFAVEVIGATVFGLLAGYVFRKSDSLYPSLITHILINSMGVLAIVGTLG